MKNLWQAVRFVIVGALNTAVDFIVFNLLAYYVIGLESSFAYFVCKSLAFLVAMANSFFFNRRVTFKDHSHKKGLWWRFSLVTIATFLVSAGISTVAFNLLVNHTSIATLLAGNIGVVVSVVVGMCSNFIGYKYFVFNSNDQATA
jgi:putative flippase GtrA